MNIIAITTIMAVLAACTAAGVVENEVLDKIEDRAYVIRGDK